MIDGRNFSQSLETSDQTEAEQKRRKIMRPFQASDRVDSLAVMSRRLHDAEREKEALEKPPLPLDQFWEKYENHPNRPDSGDSTLSRYETHCRQFLEWLKKHHPEVTSIQQITLRVAENYAQYLGGPERALAPNTYNQHIRELDLFWRTLRDCTGLSESPWSKERIRRKRKQSFSRRNLSRSEVKLVCETAEGELRLLFALGLFTALRLGDAATLRWSDVEMTRTNEFPNGRITVLPAKTARIDDGARTVSIPIHPQLRNLLKETLPNYRTGYLMSKTANLYIVSPDQLSKKIQEHFKSCGIQTTKRIPGRKRAAVLVGFHSLRHSFVSMCRDAGAPLSVVEKLVGHSSSAITQHYTHVSDKAAVGAVELIPWIDNNATRKVDPIDRAITLVKEIQKICEESRCDEVLSILKSLKFDNHEHSFKSSAAVG